MAEGERRDISAETPAAPSPPRPVSRQTACVVDSSHLLGSPVTSASEEVSPPSTPCDAECLKEDSRPRDCVLSPSKPLSLPASSSTAELSKGGASSLCATLSASNGREPTPSSPSPLSPAVCPAKQPGRERGVAFSRDSARSLSPPAPPPASSQALPAVAADGFVSGGFCLSPSIAGTASPLSPIFCASPVAALSPSTAALGGEASSSSAFSLPSPPSPLGGNKQVLSLGLWLLRKSSASSHDGLEYEAFLAQLELFLQHFNFPEAAAEATASSAAAQQATSSTAATPFAPPATIASSSAIGETPSGSSAATAENSLPQPQSPDVLLPAADREVVEDFEETSGAAQGERGTAACLASSELVGESAAFSSLLLDLLGLRGGDGAATAVDALVTHLIEACRGDQLARNAGAGGGGGGEGCGWLRIGNFAFNNRRSAKQKLKSILQLTEEGEDLQGEDFELVLATLKFHPRAQQKLRGFRGLYVGAHPNPRFHGMRTFFIRRDKEGTDATGVAAASAAPPSAGARASSLRDEDFSYVRCVDNVSAIDTQAAKAICSVLNKVRLLITPMLAMLMLFSDALLVDEAAAVVLPLLQVVAAFPSVGTVLLEKLRRAFPPLKTPPETHQAFAKSMLLLSSQLPSVGGVSRRGEGRTLRTNFSEKEPASLSATQLRGALWRLLLSKMVLIDSEIKSADPYRVDAEQLAVWKREQLAQLSLQLQRGSLDLQSVQQLLQRQEQLLQQLYARTRSEEDVDAMAKSLDALMLAVFSFLKTTLPSLKHRPSAAALEEAAQGSSTGPIANASAAAYSPCVDDSPAASPESPSQTTGAAGGGSARDKTAADEFVRDVFEAFLKVVLPCSSSKFVQFVVFFTASLDSRWALLLLQRLLEVTADKQRHIRLRCIACLYAVGFACRSTALPPTAAAAALQQLLLLLHRGFLRTGCASATEQQHQNRLRIISDACSGAPLGPENPLNLFRSCFGALCYGLCYWLDALLQQQRLSFLLLPPFGLSALLVPLQNERPLLLLQRGIARKFVAACRRVGLFKELEPQFAAALQHHQLLQQEQQLLQQEQQMLQQAAAAHLEASSGDGATQTNSSREAAEDLASPKGAALPAESSETRETQEKSSAQGEETSPFSPITSPPPASANPTTLGSTGGGRSSSGSYFISDPLYNFFPFDPLLLRHSQRFVASKYRLWENVELFHRQQRTERETQQRLQAEAVLRQIHLRFQELQARVLSLGSSDEDSPKTLAQQLGQVVGVAQDLVGLRDRLLEFLSEAHTEQQPALVEEGQADLALLREWSSRLKELQQPHPQQPPSTQQASPQQQARPSTPACSPASGEGLSTASLVELETTTQGMPPSTAAAPNSPAPDAPPGSDEPPQTLSTGVSATSSSMEEDAERQEQQRQHQEAQQREFLLLQRKQREEQDEAERREVGPSDEQQKAQRKLHNREAMTAEEFRVVEDSFGFENLLRHTDLHQKAKGSSAEAAPLVVSSSSAVVSPPADEVALAVAFSAATTAAQRAEAAAAAAAAAEKASAEVAAFLPENKSKEFQAAAAAAAAAAEAAAAAAETAAEEVVKARAAGADSAGNSLGAGGQSGVGNVAASAAPNAKVSSAKTNNLGGASAFPTKSAAAGARGNPAAGAAVAAESSDSDDGFGRESGSEDEGCWEWSSRGSGGEDEAGFETEGDSTSSCSAPSQDGEASDASGRGRAPTSRRHRRGPRQSKKTHMPSPSCVFSWFAQDGSSEDELELHASRRKSSGKNSRLQGPLPPRRAEPRVQPLLASTEAVADCIIGDLLGTSEEVCQRQLPPLRVLPSSALLAQRRRRLDELLQHSAYKPSTASPKMHRESFPASSVRGGGGQGAESLPKEDKSSTAGEEILDAAETEASRAARPLSADGGVLHQVQQPHSGDEEEGEVEEPQPQSPVYSPPLLCVAYPEDSCVSPLFLSDRHEPLPASAAENRTAAPLRGRRSDPSPQKETARHGLLCESSGVFGLRRRNTVSAGERGGDAEEERLSFSLPTTADSSATPGGGEAMLQKGPGGGALVERRGLVQIPGKDSQEFPSEVLAASEGPDDCDEEGPYVSLQRLPRWLPQNSKAETQTAQGQNDTDRRRGSASEPPGVSEAEPLPPEEKLEEKIEEEIEEKREEKIEEKRREERRERRRSREVGRRFTDSESEIDVSRCKRQLRLMQESILETQKLLEKQQTLLLSLQQRIKTRRRLSRESDEDNSSAAASENSFKEEPSLTKAKQGNSTSPNENNATQSRTSLNPPCKTQRASEPSQEVFKRKTLLGHAPEEPEGQASARPLFSIFEKKETSARSLSAAEADQEERRPSMPSSGISRASPAAGKFSFEPNNGFSQESGEEEAEASEEEAETSLVGSEKMHSELEFAEEFQLNRERAYREAAAEAAAAFENGDSGASEEEGETEEGETEEGETEEGLRDLHKEAPRLVSAEERIREELLLQLRQAEPDWPAASPSQGGDSSSPSSPCVRTQIPSSKASSGQSLLLRLPEAEGSQCLDKATSASPEKPCVEARPTQSPTCQGQAKRRRKKRRSAVQGAGDGLLVGIVETPSLKAVSSEGLVVAQFKRPKKRRPSEGSEAHPAFSAKETRSALVSHELQERKRGLKTPEKGLVVRPPLASQAEAPMGEAAAASLSNSQGAADVRMEKAQLAPQREAAVQEGLKTKRTAKSKGLKASTPKPDSPLTREALAAHKVAFDAKLRLENKLPEDEGAPPRRKEKRLGNGFAVKGGVKKR